MIHTRKSRERNVTTVFRPTYSKADPIREKYYKRAKSSFVLKRPKFLLLGLVFCVFVSLESLEDWSSTKWMGGLVGNKKNDEIYLKPFVTKYLEANNQTMHLEDIDKLPYQEKFCAQDTHIAVLEEWKRSRQQLFCNTTGPGQTFVMDQFVLKRWKHEPTIRRYRNVYSWSKRGPQYNCSKAATIKKELAVEDYQNYHASNNIKVVEDTVIRIIPFDWYNPYERFHAFLNVAMTMIMLDIRDPILVFVADESTKTKSRPAKEDRDAMETWKVFSKRKPIIVNSERGESTNKTRYLFRDFIEAPGSGLSMLNTVTDGWLRGVGGRHDCESPLLQAIVTWIRNRFEESWEKTALKAKQEDDRIHVLWSSRKPYCCRNGGKIFYPKRALANETQWIDALGKALGSDKYKVTGVDFGDLTTSETIKLVEQQNILVGVHGAGLMWSVFLPQQKNSGLVEIFMGDRDEGNNHYHNIASLAGLNYRRPSYWKGRGVPIHASDVESLQARGEQVAKYEVGDEWYIVHEWDMEKVNKVAELIVSISHDDERGKRKMTKARGPRERRQRFVSEHMKR